ARPERDVLAGGRGSPPGEVRAATSAASRGRAPHLGPRTHGRGRWRPMARVPRVHGPVPGLGPAHGPGVPRVVRRPQAALDDLAAVPPRAPRAGGLRVDGRLPPG